MIPRPSKCSEFGSSVFENQQRVLEIEGYRFERTQNIEPDDAVRSPKLEVTDDRILMKRAMFFPHV